MYNFHKVAQPELSGAYFISFTLISSLIKLTLFVGVITIRSISQKKNKVEEQM